LIDPVISERWFWAYAFNGYITTIEGTVIKYKDQPQEIEKPEIDDSDVPLENKNNDLPAEE
jgi:hypothetical protein